MRFGACVGTDVSKIDILKKYGYDYVEMSLAGVSGWSDEKIAEVRAKGKHQQQWTGGEAAANRRSGHQEPL